MLSSAGLISIGPIFLWTNCNSGDIFMLVCEILHAIKTLSYDLLSFKRLAEIVFENPFSTVDRQDC